MLFRKVEDAGLRLRLHPGKRAIQRTADGGRVVGYRVFPTHVRVTHGGKQRQVRRLRRLQGLWADGAIRVEELRASVAARRGHLVHANTYRLRRARAQRVRFVKKT